MPFNTFGRFHRSIEHYVEYSALQICGDDGNDKNTVRIPIENQWNWCYGRDFCAHGMGVCVCPIEFFWKTTANNQREAYQQKLRVKAAFLWCDIFTVASIEFKIGIALNVDFPIGRCL